MTFGLVLLELVLLLGAAHPFAIYPLTLLMMRRRSPRTADDAAPAPRPTVALCLSAYNEERVIVRKIESMLEMAAAYGPASIHVFVDGGHDDTERLLTPYADRIDLVVSATREGKTAGLNALAARSQSAIIVFTDANVVTHAGDLTKLIHPFTDPEVGCASAKLHYSNSSDSGASAAGAGYWGLEETIKALEDRTFGLIGVDGAFFAVERSVFHPAPDDLIDDLWVSLSVLCDGRRVVSVPDLWVSERSAAGSREEFRRKVRIACQAFNVHRRLWPRLKRLPAGQLYGYVSHRLLKWLSPFTLALAGADMVILAMLWLGVWPVCLVLAVATIAGLAAAAAGLRIARAAVAAFISMVGVATGVLQSVLLDRTYRTWTPAASVRDEVACDAP